MIVALVTLLVPTLACGFSDYLNQSKAAEARANVRSICTMVSDAASQEEWGAGTEVAAAGLPPAAPAGEVPCGERVMWTSSEAWDRIGFNPSDPLYYTYQYQPDADGEGFTVRAIGDLDCDSETSQFELHATRSGEDWDCAGEIAVTNELE